ncbi:hypothetical protein J6590_105725 [Homalodisca vitripennis]|nr:hypothetical protein J6590_105725 [Homalodisca vitripennis]
MSRLNVDVNRTSTRLMMILTVSSHSPLFYHVQIEYECKQNIHSTDDDLDSEQNIGLTDDDLDSVQYSLLFYHVQFVCGCEQNIGLTDDDLDSVQYSLLFYHVQFVCGCEQNIGLTDDDLDSVQPQLNADVNRASASQMMTLTVSSHSLLFYHVQIECGCEQNIFSTDDDVDSVQSQCNVIVTIKPISPCDVRRD